MIPIYKKIFWCFEGLIILIAIIGIASFGLWTITEKINVNIANNKWNNGICESCGGEYVYLQAVGHYIGTDYIYECNNCGKHIEIPKYMKK